MHSYLLIATTVLAATAACAAAAPQSLVPGFDASRAVFGQTGDMDLEDTAGSVQMTDFAVRSFLCRPVRPVEGVYVLPEAGYRFTHLDASGATGPVQDEELHTLSLGVYLLAMPEGSHWIYAGWTQAEMATDFEEINSDDFTFDLAGGVGYRFSDTFTFGVGAAATNLNGDASFYPGIGFDWVASEKLRIGFYGPTGVAAYSFNDDWLFSLRFDFSGGVWNITDNNNTSRSIDLGGGRLGLYANRRLTENLWLTAGAGLTIANELRYTTASGDALFTSDLDTTPFGMISLRMKVW